MKIYGENDYKGYLILKDKNGQKSKHYISAVDSVSGAKQNEVNIWCRSNGSDLIFNYKIGTNKNVDIAIKTWVNNRKKHNMKIGNHQSWFYDFLKKKI